MALTYDQISGITEKFINDSVADNIYTSSPAFLHMKEKGRIVKSGQDAIKLPVLTAELGAAGSFANYDILSTLPTDNISAAEYDWKRYYVNVVVSNHELLRNKGGAVDLLKAKVAVGEMQMKEQLADDFFSTNADSDKGIVGLRTLVKASGTVGEISSSDMATWVSDVDAATSALSISALEQSILDATVGSWRPDLIVTTKGVYKKVHGLAHAAQQFGSQKVAKLGFEGFLFDGIPLFWDSKCPGSGASTADNHLFALNSKYLYLFVHEDDNFKSSRIPRIAQQDIVVVQMTATLALATDNRRMHSLMSVLKH